MIMPKTKQPVQLQNLALDFLLEYVVNVSNRLGSKDSLGEFRRAISFIKEYIFTRIPWFLIADFCDKFLDQFYEKDCSDDCKTIALDLLMDTEIIGLRFKGPMVTYFDMKNANRLKKLKELDLSNFPSHLDMSLDNFQLCDLRIFICTQRCTDLHLKVIGRNCPKLEVLKIHWSKEVTDEGIRALNSCSDLRIVDISECSVSHDGRNLLLAVHKKIEEFICTNEFHDHLDSTLCPAMSRLVLESTNESPTSDHLKSIVKKFPNLIYLEMKEMIAFDLKILKYLDKLEGLSIFFSDSMMYDDVESIWEEFKELIKFIGKNFISLEFTCWNHGFFWEQDGINFVFKHCPNLEYLKFDFGGGLLVIPPFPKLKKLIPNIAIEFESIEILDDPKIEFDKLVELETLSLHNFEVNFHIIESIMLDNVKFPKLSVIQTICMKPEDLTEIERVAKTSNLNFKIENDPTSNWYIEYRFNPRSSDDDGDD